MRGDERKAAGQLLDTFRFSIFVVSAQRFSKSVTQGCKFCRGGADCTNLKHYVDARHELAN